MMQTTAPTPRPPPPEFVCAITQELMSDPVVAADGYTYERSAISQWLLTNNTSPMTGTPLSHNNLSPNWNLKSMMIRWKEKHDPQGTVYKGVTFPIPHAITKDKLGLVSSMSYNSMGWFQPTLSGKFPPARFYAAAAFNSGRLWVYGGFQGMDMYLTDDLSFLDAKTNKWFNLTGHNLDPRGSHSVVCSGIQLIYFGGVTAFGLANDLCVLDTQLMSVSSGATQGTAPSPRANHSASLVDNKMYIFGGGCGESTNNELHVLDISTMTWQQPATQGKTPAPRTYHSSAVVGKKMLIHGGAPDSKTTTAADPLFNDLFILDTETMTWAEAKCNGTIPPAIGSHTITQVGRLVFLFGGFNGNVCFNHLFSLDLDTMTWTKCTATGQTPDERAGHLACALRNKLYILGGFSVTDPDFGDLHILDIGAQ